MLSAVERGWRFVNRDGKGKGKGPLGGVYLLACSCPCPCSSTHPSIHPPTPFLGLGLQARNGKMRTGCFGRLASKSIYLYVGR